MQKDERRRELKAARSAIPVEERAAMDAGICAQVTALPAYKQAELVLPYLSFGAEVDTRGIIRDAWSCGKTVALPRCVEGTRTMRWHRVTSFDGLVKSSFGVDEPADNPATLIDLDAIDTTGAVVLVPGMEFDRKGLRLGYGGGFYDVFLSGFAGTSIGLCRDCFLSEQELEHDPHDLPVDIVATQSEAIRCKE